jgi:DNA-binding transcriptional ArsR family regulator
MVSDRSRRSSKRDRIFLSIADRSRRRILELLAGKELPAGRIAEQFTMSRPAVIKHLRILRSADLITVRRQGRERIHALNPAPLKSVQRWLAKFEAYWDEKLENLKKDVEEEARR